VRPKRARQSALKPNLFGDALNARKRLAASLRRPRPHQLRSAYRFGSGRSVLPAITEGAIPQTAQYRRSHARAIHASAKPSATTQIAYFVPQQVEKSTNGMIPSRRDNRPCNGALTGPLSLRFGNRPDKALHIHEPIRRRTQRPEPPRRFTPSPPSHRLRSASRFGSGRSVRPSISKAMAILNWSHSRGKRGYIRAIPASAKSSATFRIIHSAQSHLHVFRPNSEPMVLHPIWMLTRMTLHPEGKPLDFWPRGGHHPTALLKTVEPG